MIKVCLCAAVKTSWNVHYSQFLITLLCFWSATKEQRRNNQLCCPPQPPSLGILHIPFSPLTATLNYAQIETAWLLKWTLVCVFCVPLLLCSLVITLLSVSPSHSPVIWSWRNWSVFTIQQLEARFFRSGWTSEIVLRPPQHAPSHPPHETHLNRRYEYHKMYSIC